MAVVESLVCSQSDARREPERNGMKRTVSVAEPPDGIT
jgi:hypothetical protein